MTAGLNVPADSNASPFGDRIGSAESRVHVPIGGVKETAATAAKAMRTKTTPAAVCAVRFAEKGTLIITCFPSLRTNWTWKQPLGGPVESMRGNRTVRSKLGYKLNERLSWDLQCRLAGLAIHSQASSTFFRRRKTDVCRPGDGSGVVQNEAQLLWRKLFQVDSVKKVKVHQH